MNDKEWQLVPREPTSEMLDAAGDYYENDNEGDVWPKREARKGAYRAMLAAAPRAAAGSDGKACVGIPGVGCDYLAQCHHVCNKCGRVHNPMAFAHPPADPMAEVRAVAGELRKLQSHIDHEDGYIKADELSQLAKRLEREVGGGA